MRSSARKLAWRCRRFAGDLPELGVSTATFYNWRSKYGAMDVSLMARMKELEAENAGLRKMYVEEKIKAEIVAEALAKKD
jgi:putative transposase